MKLNLDFLLLVIEGIFYSGNKDIFWNSFSIVICSCIDCVCGYLVGGEVNFMY